MASEFPDEYYAMGRDSNGDVRANSGHGLVIARAEDSADTVRGWAERADSDHRRRLYEAAAEFIDTTPKPPRIQLADLLGETEGYLVGERCASAVIAAGWRPPARKITSNAEAQELPELAIIRTALGAVCQREEDAWRAMECVGLFVEFGDDDFPLTVLCEPEVTSE